MNWIWKPFSELTAAELYDAIQLREQIFVVEQNCVYLDCDGGDPKAWHLLGYKNGELAAYLRAFAPGVKYQEASFGRVVTSAKTRGTGLGRELVKRGLENMNREFGRQPIKISAQSYLLKFYGAFGFESVGAEYLEDGLPHTEMHLR